jgi:SAM-dependent methyltransferase
MPAVLDRRRALDHAAHGAGPTKQDVEEVFCRKYDGPSGLGPNPRLWRRHGYFLPDEFYEAAVARLVAPTTRWLDAGCGRDLFPHNPALADELARRCALLVGLDPDANVLDNRWVHEAVRGTLHDYHPSATFDLVTLRMVAEHVAETEELVADLARLTAPGGKVVVYTPWVWSPAALLARAVPFGLHHAVKRLLWRTEERDTFPVAYRMNGRGRLAHLFEGAGFAEGYFARLADCRLFARFRPLHRAELGLWRLTRRLRLGYPECCLLGVYERRGEAR